MSKTPKTSFPGSSIMFEADTMMQFDTSKRPGRVILQPIDLELLRLLADEFLLLTRQQIGQLVGRAVRRTNFRLHKLVRGGYLSRRHPTGMLMTPTPLYYLGPKAAEALGREANDPKLLLRRRQSVQLRDGALPHFLLVNSVHIKFLIAGHDYPNYELLNWIPQYAPVWNTLNQYGLTVRPDGYGECRKSHDTIRFFVEVDRGTERGAVVGNKLAAYAEYARTGRFQTHFSAPDFQVLFITSSRRRARQLMRTATLTGVDFFRVTWFEQFFAHPLFGSHWMSPQSELPQSLLLV